MGDLFGDGRNKLDGGGARSHHAYALAGHVDAFPRPVAGVTPLTFEAFQPLEVGQVPRRQDANRGYEELGLRLQAVFSLDLPAAGILVVDGGGNPGVELDVGAQVKLIGHEVEVTLVLGLGGIMLFPVPLL